MKKSLLLVLAAVAIMTGCSKGNNPTPEPAPGRELPQSFWSDKTRVEEVYEDAAGTKPSEATFFTYNEQGHLVSYVRKGYVYSSKSYEGMHEEMTGSVYSGTTHSYEIHEYDWIGIRLPVKFSYTDTYSDTEFKTITKRVVKGVTFSDYSATIDYRYEDGQMTGYHTVVEGQYPAEFDTTVEYRTAWWPSPDTFPQKVADNTKRVEIVYTNKYGNRTGFYTDNTDHGETRDLQHGTRRPWEHSQWGFVYGKGSYTYLTEGLNSPHLVRVTVAE